MPFKQLWTVSASWDRMSMEATPLSATFNIERRNSILLDCSYSYQRAQVWKTSPDDEGWMKQVAYHPAHFHFGPYIMAQSWVYRDGTRWGCSSRYTWPPDTGAAQEGNIWTSGWLYEDFIWQLIRRCHVLTCNILDRQYGTSLVIPCRMNFKN